MSTFNHLGEFPFCILEESANSINQQVAQSVEGYSGDYVGTLFPFDTNLQQAMDLFWRVKSLNFSFYNFTDFTNQFNSGGSAEAESITPATIKEFTTNNPNDSMAKRVCGLPTYLEYTMKYKFTSSGENPAITENQSQSKFGWTSANIIANSGGGGTDFGTPLFGAPRGIRQSEVYYPTMLFSFGLYTCLWASFFPHFNMGGFYSELKDTRTVNFQFTDFDGNNYLRSLTLYLIVVEQEDPNDPPQTVGETTISDFEVELWSPPS